MFWERLLLSEIPREGENGTVAAAVTPTLGGGESPTGETPPVVETPPDAPKPRPWFEKRIDSLTAEKYQLQQALEEARAARATGGASPGEQGEVAPAPTPVPPAPQQQKTYTMEEARAIAMAEAEAISFNQKCNDVANAGKNEFPDFMEAVGTINNKLGGMSRSFVEAALETGIAPKLIYSLGKDPDKAAEILAMSPVRQAVALAKYANELASKKPPVSGAPDPISSKVGGGSNSASGDLTADDMPIADWMKQRQAQIAQRRR